MNVPTFQPSTIVDNGVVAVSTEHVNLSTVEVRGQFWSDFYAKINAGYVRQCWKCQFVGRLREYGHVFAGICFNCNGRGFVGKPIAKESTLLARQDRLSKKEIARLVQIEADRPAMEAREREIRAEIVAKAEVKAYAEAEKRNAARYAGAVGEKVTVSGTVAVSLYLEPAQYGWASSRMVVVEGSGEDAGVTVKVVSSGQALYGLERGDVVTISGTVKEHAVYQDKKQTVIQRPKVAKADA